MPAKKAAKAKPITTPSKPEDRPTPRVEPDYSRPAPVDEETSSRFVKNFLWPTLMGLAAALVTALTTGLPNILADGLQPGDWPQIGGVVVAAGVGYLANILTRYGGRGSPWRDPPVEPGQRV